MMCDVKRREDGVCVCVWQGVWQGVCGGVCVCGVWGLRLVKGYWGRRSKGEAAVAVWGAGRRD